MGTRRSEYQRDSDDWYVEPDWTVDLLLDALPQIDALHDPCAGRGTVVARALRRGFTRPAPISLTALAVSTTSATS